MLQTEVSATAPMVFTVAEFCRAHRISVAFFYKLRSQGLTPAEMRVGNRVLISTEAAARWRRQREVPTDANLPAA
jgi:hypothetical protein